MSSPLIRDCEHYVVLEPSKNEKLLTAEETLQWLENWLSEMDELPHDLSNHPSKKAAAQRLLDTSCDLEISPGFTVQWFAVRLAPPEH